MTLATLAGLALLALIVAFVWWRFYFFHRNPARKMAPGTDPVCPADGRILYVETVDLQPDAADAYHRRVHSAFAVSGSWQVMATYLGIFDVHVVRAPVVGTVRLRHMAPVGENVSMGASYLFAAMRRPLPLGQRSYMQKNEFLGVEIEGTVRLLLVLMADWWIDQIRPPRRRRRLDRARAGDRAHPDGLAGGSVGARGLAATAASDR